MQEKENDILKPIIANDRDRRLYTWLIDEVGEGAIQNALSNLSGERKAYLSNICKVLNIVPPENLLRTPKDTARKNIQEILKNLQKK